MAFLDHGDIRIFTQSTAACSCRGASSNTCRQHKIKNNGNYRLNHNFNESCWLNHDSSTPNAFHAMRHKIHLSHTYRQPQQASSALRVPKTFERFALESSHHSNVGAIKEKSKQNTTAPHLHAWTRERFMFVYFVSEYLKKTHSWRLDLSIHFGHFRTSINYIKYSYKLERLSEKCRLLVFLQPRVIRVDFSGGSSQLHKTNY